MCVGTSLLLYRSFNDKNNFSKIFNFKPLVLIGLISYSLYLWHWPIISYLKYIYIETLPLKYILLSLFLIFSFSILSWRFVEQPFLYNHSKNKVLTFVGATYFILLAFTLFIILSKNLPSRYNKFPNSLADSVGSTYNCSLREYTKFGDTYACLINSQKNSNARSVLFGNSHAYMYGWGFQKHIKNINQSALIIQLTIVYLL